MHGLKPWHLTTDPCPPKIGKLSTYVREKYQILDKASLHLISLWYFVIVRSAHKKSLTPGSPLSWDRPAKKRTPFWDAGYGSWMLVSSLVSTSPNTCLLWVPPWLPSRFFKTFSLEYDQLNGFLILRKFTTKSASLKTLVADADSQDDERLEQHLSRSRIVSWTGLN